MTDLSIRRTTIAEQADAAARRFVQTHTPEQNPHEGTPDAPVWKAAFERFLLLHSLPEAEASA